MLFLALRPGQSIFIDTPQGRVELVYLHRRHQLNGRPLAVFGVGADPAIRIDREEVHLERIANAALQQPP